MLQKVQELKAIKLFQFKAKQKLTSNKSTDKIKSINASLKTKAVITGLRHPHPLPSQLLPH